MRNYDIDSLRKPNNAAKVGAAGEHLACADLILNGHNVILTAGLNNTADILIEHGDQYLRVQVKTTLQPAIAYTKKMLNQKKIYRFNIATHGYKNKKTYHNKKIDIFALVAIDSGLIAYIPCTKRNGNILFRDPALRGTYKNENGITYHNKIQKLKSVGHNYKQICSILNIPEPTYFRHHKKLKISSGSKRGYYMDAYPIDRCLSFMDNMLIEEISLIKYLYGVTA